MNREWLFGVRGPAAAQGAKPQTAQREPGRQSGCFRAELDKQLARTDVVVSNHAKQRLEKRAIRLNEADLQQIGRAIDRMAAKGGKESLILFKQTAFLVNVPNRTIITAVDQQSMKDNVFTNIDSAIFL
ncbi:TIGR02530 family flagellar biosynthesis protein [Effusibacillus pohliae]|uniref:TIGR02530 family flagellar biosynthesis protein n=1 Tax=Effusibacillus pohliae TaxID=232270 RepID=UPI00035FE659|nr:TIGR02530 family flagellar biosynthesis protein [Effusibacillus pohliae]